MYGEVVSAERGHSSMPDHRRRTHAVLPERRHAAHRSTRRSGSHRHSRTGLFPSHVELMRSRWIDPASPKNRLKTEIQPNTRTNTTISKAVVLKYAMA